MGYRFHRGFSTAEKAELWDRWKRGESLKAMERAFGKPSSSIYFLVAPHGGIRPAERRRSRLALTIAEREVIFRGITALKRPAAVEDRAVPGHWEGDLLSGPNNSYKGTAVKFDRLEHPTSISAAIFRHACHLISEAVYSKFLERQLSRSVNKPHIEAAREG